MSRSLVPHARATLALAAAAGMREQDVARALDVDPATLSRKKNDLRRWNAADSLAALDAFGAGIGDLIADLESLRATRQYQQARRADTTPTGHVA